MMIITNDYPKTDGDVLIILNNYGNNADGEEMRLDFSDIETEQIKKEAMACIVEKYKAREASPLYLKVLVPAVRHFDCYAKQKKVSSFLEYTESVAADYKIYLETLQNEGGNLYSAKYQRYLYSVPRTLKNSLERINGNS